MPLDNPSVHEAGKSVHVEEQPAAAVCDRHVINLRQVGRLARFRVATAKANVWLQDIDCLLFYEFAKPPAMTFHLSCCDRYVCMRPEVCKRTGVVLLQRLLKPSEVAVFDLAAKHFGLYWVEQIISVDHDVDIVANGVANCANASGIFAPAFLIHSDDNLHCGEATRHLQLCRFAQLFTVILRKAEG